MSPVESPTSVTDAALRDRIGVPDAVRRHLREREQAVHGLLEQLSDTDDPQAAVARAELRSVLADARRSPLLRALGRRAADLEPGGPARRSLDNALGAILSRATRALRRASAATEFRRMYDDLHARYAEPLPWHLAGALERAGIGTDTLERLRDAGSIEGRTERMRTIDAELGDRVAALPRWVDEPLEVSEWPQGVSPAELAAAVQQAERGERSLLGPAWRARGRTLAGEHARRLLGGGTGTGPAPNAAEAAAHEALRLVEAGYSAAAEDLDAHGIVLRGAARNRVHAPVVITAAAAPAAREDASGALLFVVPLFGPYVLIRRGQPWPVRVDDRGVRVGRGVRCVASLPPGSEATPLTPDVWAEPLFEVADAEAGAWLRTEKPARVVPFARIGTDRWLARVEWRGRLSPVNQPRWSSARPRRGHAVRFLPPAEEAGAEQVISVGPQAARDAGPFGWTTLQVPLAFADVPYGILRTADNAAGRDHVEAEQRFFQAATRSVPACTPRCLGRAERPHGYVYAPPLALTPESSLALRSWLQRDPQAFAAAVARLWKRLADAGLALGFYHASTLAFRVRVGTPGAPGALEAVAVAAPLGTRLGAAYRQSARVLNLFPAFERLGGASLPPAQVKGNVALPETEAAAAALYQLDLLATRPVPIPDGTPWDEVVDILAATPPGQFHGAAVAERLIAALRSRGVDDQGTPSSL
jgi:hypothetical protein